MAASEKERRAVPQVSGRKEIPVPTEVGEHRIDLKRSEKIKNPASTKHMLFGPMVLKWYLHVDGGHEVQVVTESVTADETITIQGHKVEVQPYCGTDARGAWWCVTHDKGFANNLAMADHTADGYHRMAWECSAHGTEEV